MPPLALKVPPPLVGLLCAAAAWLIHRFLPGLASQWPLQSAFAAALVLAGCGLDAWGLVAFHRARTTVSPLAPGRTSAIVRSGPFRFTRNPMYLGMAAILLGICIQLGNPASLLAVAAFVAYVTCFQILPEEQVLLSRFGQPYAAYLASVRRWL